MSPDNGMMIYFTINLVETCDSIISVTLKQKNAKITQKIKTRESAQSFLS